MTINGTDAHWQCYFFFLSNLHHYMKRDAALQSEPAGFPDKTEDKRRARVEMGNATQQLGANWRGIHYSLLPGRLGFYGKEMLLSDWWGPEALCSVVGGDQHYGATEALKLPIKGRTLGWLKELSRGLQSIFIFFFTNLTPQIWFVSWIHEDIWKNIYIFHQNITSYIEI